MTCINWVRVRNGARPGPFRGWRSSGSRTIAACMTGEVLDFSLEKERADLGVFLYHGEARKPRFQLWRWAWIPVAQWSVQRFRSETQLRVRTATTRTGDPVGWQPSPVWPPIQEKLPYFVGSKRKKERINLHHSSALLWQRRKSMHVWNLALPPLCDCCIGLSFHACCLDDCECHGQQLSLHNVMWFYLTVPLNTL